MQPLHVTDDRAIAIRELATVTRVALTASLAFSVYMFSLDRRQMP